VDLISNVTDTKGSQQKGMLTVTNLRMIWVEAKRGQNISIGFNATTKMAVRNSRSLLHGASKALIICTVLKGLHFEFVFAFREAGQKHHRVFHRAMAAYRSYDASRIFRELRIQAAIIRDHELTLLSGEEVVSRVKGVWNLSSNRGSLGVLVATPIRLVWHSTTVDMSNASIPWIQVRNLRERKSKYGAVMTVEMSPRAGGVVIGFKIDPPDFLPKLVDELRRLHQVFSASPTLSGEVRAPSSPNSADEPSTVAMFNAGLYKTEQEAVGDEASGAPWSTARESATASLYFAVQEKEADHPVHYDSENLGLAVEATPTGISTKSLWSMAHGL